MAKQLAEDLGYIYVDTGAMYRAVTLFALREGLFEQGGDVDASTLETRLGDVHIDQRRIATDHGAQTCTFLNGENVEGSIRGMDVSERVSIIAALPFVREKLVEQQRKMGERGGIVMDGRDIGTAVFPDADLKIFVTARADVRAMRRYKELQGKGQAADYDAILQNVEERDRIDSTRAVSPLRKADDAIELDNSEMTIDEQRNWLMERYKEVVNC